MYCLIYFFVSGYPIALALVDKLVDLCFIMFGLVAALVATFGFGIFFLIAGMLIVKIAF